MIDTISGNRPKSDIIIVDAGNLVSECATLDNNLILLNYNLLKSAEPDGPDDLDDLDAVG